MTSFAPLVRHLGVRLELTWIPDDLGKTHLRPGSGGRLMTGLAAETAMIALGKAFVRIDH